MLYRAFPSSSARSSDVQLGAGGLQFVRAAPCWPDGITERAADVCLQGRLREEAGMNPASKSPLIRLAEVGLPDGLQRLRLSVAPTRSETC